jgi:hypothetical protein
MWTNEVLEKAIDTLKDKLDREGLSKYYKLDWWTQNGDYGITILFPWSINEENELEEWTEFEYHLWVSDKPIEDVDKMLKRVASQVKKNEADIWDHINIESSEKAEDIIKKILKVLEEV